VVIQKPGKDDYPKLKAYHSISLLSFMGQGVEKVVVKKLLDNAR
jgi:hypothetical protein